MRQLGFVKAIDRLENMSSLDPVVTRLQAVVRGALRPRGLRDLLHGVPIGHPIHPLSVHVPLGAWISSAVLDLMPGTERASRALVGVGVAGVIPSVVTGYNDWAEMHEQQMRVGVVHSVGSAVASGIYALSFVQRARGRHGSGKLLGLLGLGVVMGAGYLGGYLSYRQAGGVNHAEEIPHRFPVGWQRLGPLDELPENELAKRDVAGLPLVALRRGTEIDVLSNVCSHMSAPLDEGELTELETAEVCVTCPWHDSVFSMRTGEVVHGPATAPQPKFETRVVDGVVEVLLPNAG